MRACCAEEDRNQIVCKEEQDVQTGESRRSRSDSARNPLRVRGDIVPSERPFETSGRPFGTSGRPFETSNRPFETSGRPFGTSGQSAKSCIFTSYDLPKTFGTFGRGFALLLWRRWSPWG